MTLSDIDDRIEQLEKKVFMGERKINSTRAQQMLLLHKLGFLESLKKFGMGRTQKAKLLSMILNATPGNIAGDLSQIDLPYADIKTAENYQFIKKVFENAGLDDLANSTEIELNKLDLKKDM